MVIRVVLILLGILVWSSGADAWQSGSDNKDGWQEPNAWEIHTPSRPSCPVCEVHKPSEDNCPICETFTPSSTECPVCEINTLSSTECPVCEMNTLSSTDCPLCPVCEHSKENVLATMFYKKMIVQLFDRGTLKANAETGKLERSVVFSLTSSQLKIIENTSDVQNLNLVVTAILNASKQPVLRATEDSAETPNMILEFLSVFSSYLLKFLGFIWNYGSRIPNVFYTVYSYSSELRFAMFVCIIILSIVFIHKRYNKNLIILVIVSFIGFGYFCTYLECNRKLEAEEFIQFIEQTEPEPDDDRPYFGKTLYDFFKPSKKEQKIKMIKDNAKVKLPFCRPDHVLIQYFNDLFFDELQLVVVELSDSMGVLQSKLPWPWNYVGMIALPFLFMSFLPLLFQYVFNPAIWLSALRSPSSNQHPNQHPNQNPNYNMNAVPQGDRLSGDNLKILFEVLKSKEKPETSGVEIVKDLPQATPAPIEDICATEGIQKRKEAIANNNILEEETTKEECNSSEEEKSRKES